MSDHSPPGTPSATSETSGPAGPSGPRRGLGPLPQGWGPYAAPPVKRRRGPAVVGGVVVVAALAAGGAYLVLRSRDSGDSPHDVVTGYFDAVADRDCEQMAGFVTRESLTPDGGTAAEGIQECQDAIDGGLVSVLEVTEVETIATNDDTATVSVTATVEGERRMVELLVVEEDGDWKLDVTSLGDNGAD